MQICDARITFRPDLGLQWSALLNSPSTCATAFYDLIKEDNLHVVMSPHNHPVFVLHTQTSRALQQLETFPGVRFQVSITHDDWLQEIQSGERRTKTTGVSTNVYVYGTRAVSSTVGEKLSKAKVFLQEPDVFPPFIVYENPHYYDVPRQEAAVPDSVTQNVEATNGNDTPLDHQIFQMLDSLDSRNHLEEVEVDARITTSLLR